MIRKRSPVLVVLLLLASFLMRRRPNVSDLERSWKPLINKEEKPFLNYNLRDPRSFKSLQLQSKKVVPTKSNRISKLFFWYSERQHCLSLQYTMLASHHLIYIKLKQSVQWSMLCLCWFVCITVAWINFPVVWGLQFTYVLIFPFCRIYVLWIFCNF